MTATPVRIRPASAEDLPACAAIWKAGLDGYGMALGRPALAPASRPILDLLEHLHSTDGDRFLVAEGGGGGPPGAPHGAPPVAFVSAIRRSQVWFLSMLFVRPDAQARGLGRRLLQAVLPAASEGATLATCTDAAQPVSNGLYAGLGMVPRVPVLELVGRPDPARLPPLPAGVRAEPIEVAGGAAPAAVLDGLDREILGYAHPEDHAWLTAGGRLGFLYRAAAGEVLGYGYASTVGRMGPIAVRDEALLPGVLGHLLGAVSPAGAFAAWVPGAAGAAVTTLLRAGLRLEDFPELVCWDRPFADFSRYVPTSLAVLWDGPGAAVVASLPIVTTATPHPRAAGPAGGQPVLALRGVGKTYPNGKVALRDVDLSLGEGEFVFLVGPSGAGKSTLLRLLIRDELPTSGEIVVAGRDLARVARKKVPGLRRTIGIVFQDFKLLPARTVRENVAFALEVTGTPRSRIGPAVERALAVVGLSAAAEQLPTTLSGGEQQRTAIARALVHEPRLFIADEPTGNLDPLISWEIIQLLLRINELGVTVLMATHNADVVTSLRRRVVALEEGRIVRDEVGGYHRDD